MFEVGSVLEARERKKAVSFLSLVQGLFNRFPDSVRAVLLRRPSFSTSCAVLEQPWLEELLMAMNPATAS